VTLFLYWDWTRKKRKLKRKNKVIGIEREVEIKFKVDQNILSRLKDIKLEPYEEVDEYFTTKEMLNNFTFLRIRRKKGKTILQLKDVIKGGKDTEDCYESDELHLELDEEQCEKIRRMLSKTFPHSFTIKKIRSKGTMNDCEICLDDVEGLGRFLEIEGEREKILVTCNKLNLDTENRDMERGYAIMMSKKLGLL